MHKGKLSLKQFNQTLKHVAGTVHEHTRDVLTLMQSMIELSRMIQFGSACLLVPNCCLVTLTSIHLLVIVSST